MVRCDVVVVGGGPAGSTLARWLVPRGLDVVVLDRRRFPRDKVCGGWITPAVVETLELDLTDYARGRVLQPIHAFRVCLLGSPDVGTRRSPTALSYGIRRREFDDYLLRRSGARVRDGEPLAELTRDEAAGEWVVNGQIRSPLIVGAGGHFCPVAERLGSTTGPREEAVTAQELEFEMTPAQREACTVKPDVPELYYCRDLRGYGWAFRKGDVLNVGLGRKDPHGLPRHVAAFRELLIERHKLAPDAPPKFRGHVYHTRGGAGRELHGDGFLLVGDAAGLAYPESGEGIRPAVESSILAAQVVLAARGDYRREKLAPYRDRIRRRFGARSERPGFAGALPLAARRFLAGRLLAAPWLARRIVVERWFLHAHVPPLAASSY